VAEVEQRGAKSGRLTEGPQRLRYATDGTTRKVHNETVPLVSSFFTGIRIENMKYLHL
jgi:hypothetical protein